MLAGSGCESFQFLHSQELFLGFGLLGKFEVWDEIVLDTSEVDSFPENRNEFSEIIVGGGCHHRASGRCLYREKIVKKTLAEVNRQVIETALTLCVVVEMSICSVPIMAVATFIHLLTEEVEEAFFTS